MSKRRSKPVLVKTQTLCPSVTGDGVDMFALRTDRLPPPNGFFHRMAPVFRFTHHSSICVPCVTLTNIRSPQMIGVEPLRPGRSSFQWMLSRVLH